MEQYKQFGITIIESRKFLETQIKYERNYKSFIANCDLVSELQKKKDSGEISKTLIQSQDLKLMHASQLLKKQILEHYPELMNVLLAQR